MKSKLFAYFIVLFLFVLIVNGMWQSTNQTIEDKVIPMETYSKVANWLSQNIDHGKISYVSTPQVFYVINPELRGNLEGFKSIWDSEGIILHASTTDAEIMQVRNHLKEIIRSDNRIQYLIFDWIDPYAIKLNEARSCKTIGESVTETTRFMFVQKYHDWASGIIVCKIHIDNSTTIT